MSLFANSSGKVTEKQLSSGLLKKINNGTAMNSSLGDLSKLDTDSKSNMVGAINEVADRIGNLHGRIANVSDQMSDLVQYPVKPSETGVKVVTYPYGDIRRYGAVDSTTTDSTPFVQNAINSSFALGTDLLIPEGTYRINGTLKLPSHLSIRGSNASNYAFSNFENIKSKIINYAKNLFEPLNITDTSKGIGSLTLKMSGVYIHNSYSPARDQTLFNKIEHLGSNIENNIFHNHGTIIQGALKNVSFFNNNRCTNIGQSLLNSKVGTRTDGISQDTEGIVDSYLEKNYLSGDSANNITLLQSSYAGNAFIRSNFIEYCKYVFDFATTGDVMYDSNSIDYVFNVWKTDIVSSTIINNIFSHISPSYLSKFPNADNEMRTGEWWVINRKKVNRTTISNNRCSNNVSNFIYIKGLSVFNLTINGNSYDTSVVNKIKFETAVSNATTDNKNIYIDEFMNKRFDTLPNPKLNSTALETSPTVTFDGMQVIHNGKILFNDNGKWKDLSGLEIRLSILG